MCVSAQGTGRGLAPVTDKCEMCLWRWSGKLDGQDRAGHSVYDGHDFLCDM